MAIDICYTRLKDYLAKEDLDKEIPKSRWDYLARRLNEIKADSMTLPEFRRKAQEFIDQDLARQAAMRKAINTQVLLKRESRFEEAAANFNDPTWKDHYGEAAPFRAVQATILGGGIIPGDQVRSNNFVASQSLFKRYFEVLRGAIDMNPDLKKVKDLPALNRDTIMELDAINNGTQGMTTGNELARQYAKAIKSAQDLWLKDEMAINPRMEAKEGYLVKHFYDPERVSQRKREDFVSLMMEKAGKDSFIGADPAKKAGLFGEMYNNIMNGRWGTPYEETSLVPQKGGNLAARMAASRQVNFNDAAAFADVNDQLGHRTIYESLVKSANRAANDIGMMDRWGPAPQVAFESFMRKVENGLQGAELDHFQANKKALLSAWETAQRRFSAPAYNTFPKIVQGALSMTFAGRASMGILRALPDLNLAAGLMRQIDGSNILTTIPQMALSYARLIVDPGARAEVLGDLSVAHDTAAKLAMAQMGGPHTQPGAFSRIAQMAGYLTLSSAHHNTMSAVMADFLATRIARISSIEHANLSPEWQQGLKNYGINANAWDVMRRAVDTNDGRAQVTPESVRNMPDTLAEIFLRKEGQWTKDGAPPRRVLDAAKLDLSLRLGGAMNENAALASAKPDLRQKDFMWAGTSINDPGGAARRLFYQFKAASLVTYDVARRTYYGGTGPKGDLAGLAQFAGMQFVLAGVGKVLYDLAHGKTPEDPTKEPLKYFADLTARSALGGIFVDTIADSLQRTGINDKVASVTGSIAGPAVGLGLDTAMTGVQAAMDLAGKKGKLSSGTKTSALNLGLTAAAPIINTVYTKGLFEYYLGNTLREWASPGFTYRAEKRMRDKGQEPLMR